MFYLLYESTGFMFTYKEKGGKLGILELDPLGIGLTTSLVDLISSFEGI